MHTLSVLVENSHGVLARVAVLFARRGFNIHSLSVGPTENPALSRMTIMVDVEGHQLEQITKQLNKLINVIKIVELEQAQAVQRELILVKVRADVNTRSQVLDLVQLFGAKVVDLSPEALVIEACSHPDKLAGFLEVLRPFGITELSQSGSVAIGRGQRSISDRALHLNPTPAPPPAPVKPKPSRAEQPATESVVETVAATN